MPIDPKLLRRLFAGGAVLAVLVVSGFYLRGILKVKRDFATLPGKIDELLSQSTTGFTFSKSQGGRTLFTIHASRYEQFKDGGRGILHDVNIIVYGQEANRFDQIYGSDFEYDESSGDVVAKGEVHIDLESDSGGASRPDQAPPAGMKNPIHVKTSGLTFNKNTGMAHTKERIEFRIPEASGSAIGADYDSRVGMLTLHSDVRLVTTEKQKVSIAAREATITKEPRKAILQFARIDQLARSVEADKITLLLRNDNMVDHILASGNVRAVEPGPKGFHLSAPEAEVVMGERDQVRTGSLFNGVVFESSGEPSTHGVAGKVQLDFGPNNQVVKIHGENAVQLSQGPAGTSNKSMQLQTDAADLYMKNGKVLDRGISSGSAQIIQTQNAGDKTTITAGQLQAKFNDQNRIKSVVGSSNTRIVASSPGKPDRISTGRDLVALYDDKGELRTAEQTGDFHYQEGQRTATAERARYVAGEETLFLSGSPRMQDSGMAMTAESVLLNRKTNVVSAQGDVKTTYIQGKQQGGGGMLGSSDPIHVTGATMEASRNSDVAKYTNARLWQAADVIEAPVMTFDKAHSSLDAQGTAQRRVTAAFTEKNQSGKATPVNVSADRLVYADGDRKAIFTGNVLVRGAETTMTGDTVEIFLLPRGGQPGSQLDHIVAHGNIEVRQHDRRAVGNQLVYTPQDEKFVMTGGNGREPRIFDSGQGQDSARGQVTGVSLTFYTHDGRVLVDRNESSQSQTQPKNQNASQK
ncbi:MAG TPA: LptA/OstA family protein [Candidatus Angelobacter sp.]|nr:LptA/OstA family protein [Candidatus Angelobacter sp.]